MNTASDRSAAALASQKGRSCFPMDTFYLATSPTTPWPIGVNFLEKIQVPNLPSIYGAMLAGVTYVLMGAGIPRLPPRKVE